jgi:chemotaxis protein CheX
MQTELQLDQYQSDIYQFAESVFASMLGLYVQPSDAPLPSTDMITGAVYYAGPWKGAVLLQCDLPEACDFTARLMGIEKPTGFNEDVRDAVGEVTNILAGNFKPILPHGVALSMPSVVAGAPSCLKICGNGPILKLAFSCEAGLFWLTILGLTDETS